MSAFFVTGTDTSVGKTVVSAALLAAARRRQLKTAALKPAETGCLRDSRGSLRPADAHFLHRAAGAGGDPSTACVHAYEMPAAPAVAARREGDPPSFAAITRRLEHLHANHPDFLLVEGAGGLLVPFTETQNAADLARALALPLIIVARPHLGTLNHCALTVEAAHHRSLTVAGIIFSASHPPSDDPTLESNAAEVQRLTHTPVLGTLPHTPSLTFPELATAAETHLHLTPLFPT